MKPSIAELFAERDNDDRNNNNPVVRNISNVSDRIENKPRSTQVEAGIKDPLGLMHQDDVREVNASKVDISECISDLGTLWSGSKSVDSESDMSKYAGEENEEKNNRKKRRRNE